MRRQDAVRGKSRGSWQNDEKSGMAMGLGYYGDRDKSISGNSRKPVVMDFEKFEHRSGELFVLIFTSFIFSLDALKSDDNFWCYHCASQINKVSPEMRTAIRKFMDLRRGSYEPGKSFLI